MNAAQVMCRVTYVDGSVLEFPAARWQHTRGEGVAEVLVFAGRTGTRFQAASLYWLYPDTEREPGVYWAGCGSVRYDPNPLTEVRFYPDGTQEERRVPYMPDLPLKAVKLGHWKDGQNVLA